MADIDDRDNHARDSLTRGFNARDGGTNLPFRLFDANLRESGELSPSDNRACNSARKYTVTSDEKLCSDAF